jgi:hypothetical protein
MRKFLMAIPLVAAMTLAGCATTGTDNKNFLEQVRQAAVAVCGFLPAVDTVVAIVATGNPIAATVAGLANAICAAVTALPPAEVRRGAPPPTVAGVVIHGKFVNR